MPTGFKKDKVDITPPDPKPIFTILLVVQMAAFVASGKIDWVDHTAFVPLKYAELLATGQYPQLIQYIWGATFAQLTAWIWIPNALFMWIFGYQIEMKLKTWRYPLFILVSLIAAWTVVYATAGFNVSKQYIGPSMLLFAMLGGYFVYLPKKPFVPQQWLRPNTEIFRSDTPTPIHERYWVSPWLYITAFAVFEIVLQAMMVIGKEGLIARTHMDFLGMLYPLFIGRMQAQPAAFAPLAAAITVGIGAGFAQILPKFGVSLKPKRPGGKLQLEVIQHYRELRTLDMTHEQACEGAARFSAVPIDIAKDWIAKGAAGLKDQDTQR